MTLRSVIFIFWLFNSTTCYLQDTITVFYNSEWQVVSEPNATYYRKAYLNSDKLWVVNDYFLDGTLQMTGFYTSEKFKTKTGHYVYYHSNGNKWMEGNFVKGAKTGQWLKWHENSNLSEDFTHGKKGLYDGPYKTWYEDGTPDIEGSYIEGHKYGTWNYYHPNGAVASIEKYEKSVLQSFEYFDEEGEKVKGKNLKIFQEPTFPGGQEAYFKFLVDNLKYPQEAIDAKAEGTVVVSFLVSKTGEISKIQIDKGIHKLLDRESLRFVESFPTWIPGRFHNRLIEVNYLLPIHFNFK